MKKLFNVKLIKKINGQMLDGQQIDESWAKVINGSELYVTKAANGKDVELLFRRRKSLVRLNVTKEFAREHFEITGTAENYEGKEISAIINVGQER